MKFSTLPPAVPAVPAVLGHPNHGRTAKTAKTARTAATLIEKSKAAVAIKPQKPQKPQEPQPLRSENSKIQTVPAGQGGRDTPRFLTQEELDFLDCREPDFLRKVRHTYVQQRLADYPDHYREWFIDELSDPDSAIVSIGIRGIGIADTVIARADYDRDRVLACLSHFQQEAPDDPKATLLDMAGVTVYEARRPFPGTTLSSPAAVPENMPQKAQEGPIEPEFTLKSVTVESEDSAAATLAELGYKVRYLRDPETANKALAEVLNAGHRLLGLDLETMPKPAFATHPKGGLDAYRRAR